MLNNFLVNQLPDKINFFDVGASGSIRMSLPRILWNKVNTFAFEPNKKTCDELSQSGEYHKVYNCALWSSEKELKLYVNENPFTSSVFPPNTNFLEQFRDHHNKGRVVREELIMKAQALSSLVDDEVPHLLKIDTQGAELEILKGAESLLKKYAPVVITEAWTREVYRGIPHAYEIMEYMKSLGYEVYDLSVAAAWGHKGSTISNYKFKNIGLDLLFVKSSEALKATELADREIVILAALLEVYGFRDFSYYVLEKFSYGDVSVYKNGILANDKKDSLLLRKILVKILRILKLDAAIHRPQLHY